MNILFLRRLMEVTTWEIEQTKVHFASLKDEKELGQLEYLKAATIRSCIRT
jgi:hypothetical protein